jgi:hypothetical protein
MWRAGCPVSKLGNAAMILTVDRASIGGTDVAAFTSSCCADFCLLHLYICGIASLRIAGLCECVIQAYWRVSVVLPTFGLAR